MKNITTARADISVKCDDVNSYKEGLSIVNELKQQMLIKVKTALGLAHNQIKGSKNVYVTRYNGKLNGYINPTVVDRSIDQIPSVEGCLSYPGEENKVLRYRYIIVEHLTEDGFVQEIFRGKEAIIHQHEIDHLLGIDIFNINGRYYEEEQVLQYIESRSNDPIHNHVK